MVLHRSIECTPVYQDFSAIRSDLCNKDRVPPTLAGNDEHRLTAELACYISNLDIEVRYYMIRALAADVCVERWMQISVREFITAIHGLFFGSLFILGMFGVVVELIRSAYSTEPSKLTEGGRSLASFYLSITAALGWAAVLAGTYIIYPWYRAVPPAGTTDFTGFPKSLLLASSATSGWHNLGMEWKEYVAWLAPTAITMVAYVWTKQRPAMKKYPQVRKAVLVFALVAFAAAGAAGLFGAMINKNAPLKGGSEIHLLTEH